MVVELLTAVGLLLVLEGLLPFLKPSLFKRSLRALLQISDHQMRIAALSSMISGVILLAIVR